MEEENSVEQSNNRPWLYKKGQSGNPKGRPPGQSLKEYLRMKFKTMTDEEKEEFFDGTSKIELFKMAEGNPESKTDITTDGEKINLNTEQFERVIRARADKLGNKESEPGGAS